MFPGRGWVLFRHDTYVVFTKPIPDMKSVALETLRRWGPVHPGSPSGDFSVLQLRDAPGWVVAGDHPDVLTYVAPDELPGNPTDLEVGLLGRSKRDRDGKELDIVHEEPWRTPGP
jgi:hypothetical protein